MTNFPVPRWILGIYENTCSKMTDMYLKTTNINCFLTVTFLKCDQTLRLAQFNTWFRMLWSCKRSVLNLLKAEKKWHEKKILIDFKTKLFAAGKKYIFKNHFFSGSCLDLLNIFYNFSSCFECICICFSFYYGGWRWHHISLLSEVTWFLQFFLKDLHFRSSRCAQTSCWSCLCFTCKLKLRTPKIYTDNNQAAYLL